MPWKPVGIDENSRFPPRVQAALADMFVTKPVGISDGQFLVWHAATAAWVARSSGEGITPSAIDGGAPINS